MTISGQGLFQSTTTSLVGYDKFFPANISVPHRQLRNLVRVTDGDKLYYVNDTDIFVLDVRTNQSILLATIPFEACCLGVGHGWIAAGAQVKGHCVFIRLDTRDSTPKCFGHDMDEVVLGSEIVNSINIQLLHDDDDAGAEPEPVALVSNNDRTVTVYSLERSQILATLPHDAPMNYAVLSPDSTLLAAVGDTDKVYFYKRRLAQRDHKHEGPWSYSDFDWRPLAIPQVPTGIDVPDDHGFAVTFSPTGHLCAASSQSGVINVFDMEHLQSHKDTPEDALLCSFVSSRPILEGCVRSMAFSPAPWDLLAWAEDHQYVGVVDVRQMFVRRQIISLDRDKPQNVVVDDATPEIYRNLSTKEKQHLSRLRTMGPASGTSRVFDTLLAENRADAQQRRLRRREIMAYHRATELDARERSVVNALETTMDDVEHRPQPYSVNYTSPPRFRPSHLADPSSAEADARLLAAAEGRSFRVYQPRRRTSVILSDLSGRSLVPPDSPRARISASPGRMTDDEDMPSMSTNDLTPSAGGVTSMPRTSDIPTSDGWHVIQSALESARRTDENREDQNSLEQIESALEAEHRFAMQLEQQLADERSLAIDLRRQIDSHDLRIQEHQRELAAINDTSARLEPSINRLLRRDLAHERDSGDRRSAELEEEMRLTNFRTLGLESARDRVMELQTQALRQSTISSSAQSSALPITSTHNRTYNRRTGPGTSASTVVSNTEALRRQRTPHVENLERQHRRAEARMRLANTELHSSDVQSPRSPESSSQAFGTSDDSQPIAQMRANIAARVAASRPARDSATAAREANLNNLAYHSFITPNAQTPRQGSEPSTSNSERMQASVSRAATIERLRAARQNTSSNQSQQQASAQAALLAEAAAMAPGTATRPDRTRSELVGRFISERDQRLAQAMFRANNQRSMDANGNWVSGGMRRFIQAGNYEESELGTTGIGWSEDGSSLFAGSEKGIFQFKVNLRDRMTFPAVEFR